MDSYHQDTQIKSLAENDRPREKFALLGQQHLSNSELLAILIGSGTPSLSAVDVSKSILASVSNDLNQLAQLSVTDLMKFPGIGEAKAIAIASAIELGRRRTGSAPSTDRCCRRRYHCHCHHRSGPPRRSYGSCHRPYRNRAP